MDEEKKYRLDKTAFQAMSAEEADIHYGFWKKKSMQERLNAACYLINQFYSVTEKTPVDKTVIKKRKHKNA